MRLDVQNAMPFEDMDIEINQYLYKNTDFDCLPIDILIKILKYLPVHERCNLAMSSRRLYVQMFGHAKVNINIIDEVVKTRTRFWKGLLKDELDHKKKRPNLQNRVVLLKTVSELAKKSFGRFKDIVWRKNALIGNRGGFFTLSNSSNTYMTTFERMKLCNNFNLEVVGLKDFDIFFPNTYSTLDHWITKCLATTTPKDYYRYVSYTLDEELKCYNLLSLVTRE